MAISTEVKVGVFFLIGLAILGVVTFMVEDLGSLLERKVEMRVRLHHATGLKEGDPVAVAGVRVGEIRKIRLLEDAVELVLSIDAKAPIRAGAMATVAWGGLLGNRYLDISLGDPSAPRLPPGSLIPAGRSVELGQLFQKADSALSEVQDILAGGGLRARLDRLAEGLLAVIDDIRNQSGTIGKLIGSDELYTKALNVASDLEATSADLHRLVQENESRIGGILEELESAIPEAREALATIRRVGESVESGEGVLPALLRDKQMYQDLKDALARLDAALDRIERFTQSLTEGKGLAARLAQDERLAQDFEEAVKSLRAVAQRLETGDNTLARLTRDKDLYEDAKRLLDDARETLRSVKEQVPVGTFASLLLSAF